jgi:mannose-1-phosphate guanylyltransferase
VKAFLLAAGEGRRLRPLTDSLPKCLVPVAGTPLIGLWLRLLELHGVSDVLINVHHHHEQVMDFLTSFPSTVAVHTVHEPRLLGSAGTVLTNRRFVEGEESFLVMYGDVLTTVDLTAITRFHAQRREALTIGITPTDKPKEKGTVIVGTHGEVMAFEEKAAEPRSNLANAGVYVARQRLFDYLPPSTPHSGVLDFGHDILPRMIPDIAAYEIGEFLMDIGTPDMYARAQRIWPGLPAPTYASR